jgi:hypothetical protein
MKRVKRSLIYILLFAIVLIFSMAGRFLVVVLLPALLFVLDLFFIIKFHKNENFFFDMFITYIVIFMSLFLGFSIDYFFDQRFVNKTVYDLIKLLEFLGTYIPTSFLYFSIIYLVFIRIKK